MLIALGFYTSSVGGSLEFHYYALYSVSYLWMYRFLLGSVSVILSTNCQLKIKILTYDIQIWQKQQQNKQLLTENNKIINNIFLHHIIIPMYYTDMAKPTIKQTTESKSYQHNISTPYQNTNVLCTEMAKPTIKQTTENNKSAPYQNTNFLYTDMENQH